MDSSDERSEEDFFSSCQSSWLVDFAICSTSRPHLILKEAQAHLHLSRRSGVTTPIDCTNWEEFEDRLLRVLNYKFYDGDLKILFYNQKYVDGKTQSDPNDGEGVMQSIVYDEYVADSRPRQIEVIRPLMPIRQESSINSKLKLCRQFYRFWRNVLTFKFCRRRRVPQPIRPIIQTV